MVIDGRFRVVIGEVEIEVITDPGQVKEFNDGDEVPVRFDPAKIWVLGPDSTDMQATADSAQRAGG